MPRSRATVPCSEGVESNADYGPSVSPYAPSLLHFPGRAFGGAPALPDKGGLERDRYEKGPGFRRNPEGGALIARGAIFGKKGKRREAANPKQALWPCSKRNCPSGISTLQTYHERQEFTQMTG